jgi:hypothetical protein
MHILRKFPVRLCTKKIDITQKTGSLDYITTPNRTGEEGRLVG